MICRLGWKAPRNSTKRVYPEGLINDASDDEVNVSFRPTPNYAALAEAATGSEKFSKDGSQTTTTWMKGVRVRNVRDLREALREAAIRVGQEGRGMLIEVLMED